LSMKFNLPSWRAQRRMAILMGQPRMAVSDRSN
jgi:hypothetical protein